MRRWFLFLLFSAWMLAACRAPEAAPPPAYEPISGQDFDGVIVPAERGADFALEGEFWTPSEFDVLALEAWLEKYLADNGQEPLALKLEEYQRQYVGVQRGEERLVLAIYFCDAGGVDWRSQPVSAPPGEDCAFQIEYNVDTGLFANLTIQ
ncbi:MAG: hypothetical protein L0Z70_11080 [Chloroflexi bacterium]|nr:hypothetical protein [Chloroflexota bacterium]